MSKQARERGRRDLSHPFKDAMKQHRVGAGNHPWLAGARADRSGNLLGHIPNEATFRNRELRWDLIVQIHHPDESSR